MESEPLPSYDTVSPSEPPAYDAVSINRKDLWTSYINQEGNVPNDINELHEFSNKHKFGLQYHEVAEIFFEGQKQKKVISKTYYNDIPNENIWREYIKQYGNIPNNASELHEFAKIAQPNNTMKYSEARKIFENETLPKQKQNKEQNKEQNNEQNDDNLLNQLMREKEALQRKVKDMEKQQQQQQIQPKAVTQSNVVSNTQPQQVNACCVIM
eukprot:255548_1